MRYLLLLIVLLSQFVYAQYPGGVQGVSAWFQTNPSSEDINQFLWSDLSGFNRKLFQTNQSIEYGSAPNTEINFGSWGLYFDNYTTGGEFNLDFPLTSHTVIAPFIPVKTDSTVNLWSFTQNNSPFYNVTLGEVIWNNTFLETLDYGSENGVDWFSPSQNLLERRAKVLSYRMYGTNINPTRLFNTQGGSSKIKVGENLGGYIPEFILFDRVLANIERQKIESYLAIKYGITLYNNSPYLNKLGEKLWHDADITTYHNRVTGLARSETSGLSQNKSVTNYEEPFGGQYSIETQTTSRLTVNSPDRLLAIGLLPQEDRIYKQSLVYYEPKYQYNEQVFDTNFDTLTISKSIINDKITFTKIDSLKSWSNAGFKGNESLSEGDYISWIPKGEVRVGLSQGLSRDFETIDNFVYTTTDNKIYVGQGKGIETLTPTNPTISLATFSQGENFKIEVGSGEIIVYKGNTKIYNKPIDTTNPFDFYVSIDSLNHSISDLKLYKRANLINQKPNDSYQWVDKPGDGFILNDLGKISKTYPINVTRGLGKIALDIPLNDGDRVHWKSAGSLRVGLENQNNELQNYLTQNNGQLSVGKLSNQNIYNKQYSYIPSFDKLTLERKNGKLLYYINGLLLDRQSTLEQNTHYYLTVELDNDISFIKDFDYEPFESVKFEANWVETITEITQTQTLKTKLQEGDYITWQTQGETMVGITPFMMSNETLNKSGFSLFTKIDGSLVYLNKNVTENSFGEPTYYNTNDTLKLEIKNGRVLYYKNDVLLNGQSDISKEGVGNWWINVSLTGAANSIKNLKIYKINPNHHRLDESYLMWGDNNQSLDFESQSNQLLKGVKMLKRKWKVKANNFLREDKSLDKESVRTNIELSLNRVNEGKNDAEKFVAYSGSKPTGLNTNRKQWLIIDKSGEGTFAPENVRMIEQTSYNQNGDGKLWFNEVDFDSDGNGIDHFTFGYTDGFLVATKQTPIDCKTNNGSVKFWIETNLTDALTPKSPFTYSIKSNLSGFVERNGQFNSISDSIHIDNLLVGDYVLEVRDSINQSVITDVRFINNTTNLFAKGDEIISFPYLNFDKNQIISTEVNAKDNINPTLADELLYTWTLPNGNTFESATIMVQNEGTYKITISDAKGCINLEDSFEVNSFTSQQIYAINPTQVGKEIKVFIDYKQAYEVKEVKVFNRDLKLVEQNYQSLDKTASILYLKPINTKGVYYVALNLFVGGVEKKEFFKIIIN